MHDIAWVRENVDLFVKKCRRRGLDVPISEILELDLEIRRDKTISQGLRHRRKELSRTIGAARSRGIDATSEIAEVGTLKEEIGKLERGEHENSAKLNAILADIPNLVDYEVPVGLTEEDNREIRRVGVLPEFGFTVRDHVDIGVGLGLMDFETAAEMSGSRFVLLKGALARLEKALAMYMLDVHTTEFGYTEISGPLLVRAETAYGTGNLPKFEDDLFRTSDGRYLIPTAEMTLTSIVRQQILDQGTLPLRYTSFTPCFRSEAGAAGKDTRGMIRHHQFWKVELVSITEPVQSEAEHQRMTVCAETILQRLELPYRVVVLSAGDIGFSAQRTYDLEVWLPGQNTYREISSCSNCGDFQARRMNARFRSEEDRSTRFVHTLNGSGLAVGRTLIAVLENFQNNDGSVSIPDVIQPYMGGMTRIEAVHA